MSEVFNADVLDAINRALSAENVVTREGEEPVYCNVNNETREIEIPGEITIFGVEHDENAVRVFFKCPKIIGDNVDIDITQSMVYIIYINAGGEKDQYIVTDVNETEDGNVTFSWLINRKPAKYQGITQFGIRVIKSKTGGEIENEWNTTVANANILNGVETEDIELSGDNIDVVNQLLDLTKQEIELTKQNSIEEIEQKGQETLETIPDDYTALQNDVSSLSEDIINQYQNILDNNNLVPDILFDNLTESWGENNTWYYNWTNQYTYNVIKSKEVLYKGFPTLSVQLSNATGKTIVINHRIILKDYIDKEVYVELAMYVDGDSIPEMAQFGIGRTVLNFVGLKSGWNSVKGTIITPSNETNNNIRLVVGGNCHVYFSPVLITYNNIPNKYTRLTIEETTQEIKKAIKEGTDWKQKIEYAMPKNNKNEITVDFSVSYNYCDDIPLYLYLETLFNEQVSITNGIGGMNQIVQNASIGGFWVQNITGTPKGKKVEIANNKKVLFIGDSYTAAGVYPKYVYDKLESIGKTVTLIGTQGTSPYKHEGHSGWRNYTYANCAKGSDDIPELGNTINPFWNPATSKFDFSYYIQNNSLLTPDIVFINLGTNDFTQSVERTETETLNAMNTIVNSIKSYNSNIKIIHWCPALTPIGIRGFVNHWDGIIKYTNLLVNNFTNLCPVRYAFSPSEDGQFETQVINGHEYRVLKDWNHPSDIGYEHIANMICGYITN